MSSLQYKMIQMKAKLGQWISIWFLILTVATVTAQEKSEIFELAGHEVSLSGEFDGFEVKTDVKKISGGLEIATITLKHETGTPPPKFSLNWKLPSSNVAGYWSTRAFTDKTIGPSWGPSSIGSMLAKEAPVITLFGHDDTNRLSFSASEALNTTILSTGVKEEDGMIYNEIIFFSEPHKALKEYKVQVRFDARPLPYSKVLDEVAHWWASFDSYKPAKVPEVARLPVYSSWYSYHQNVSMAELLSECKLAKKWASSPLSSMTAGRHWIVAGVMHTQVIGSQNEFLK